MKIPTHLLLVPALLMLGLAAVSCEGPPTTDYESEALHAKVMNTIQRFKTRDPSIKQFFDSAYGYAVFPSIGKGAAGIGGAHGYGEVFEQGEVIGVTELSQATIGFQLGGQTYREIIFFKDQLALQDFTSGEYAFSAQASAVAAEAGAAAETDYESGVAVFLMVKGGLMAEASVGGQQFRFYPK